MLDDSAEPHPWRVAAKACSAPYPTKPTAATAHAAATTHRASLGRWTLHERAPAPMRHRNSSHSVNPREALRNIRFSTEAGSFPCSNSNLHKVYQHCKATWKKCVQTDPRSSRDDHRRPSPRLTLAGAAAATWRRGLSASRRRPPRRRSRSRRAADVVRARKRRGLPTGGRRRVPRWAGAPWAARSRSSVRPTS